MKRISMASATHRPVAEAESQLGLHLSSLSSSHRSTRGEVQHCPLKQKTRLAICWHELNSQQCSMPYWKLCGVNRIRLRFPHRYDTIRHDRRVYRGLKSWVWSAQCSTRNQKRKYILTKKLKQMLVLWLQRSTVYVYEQPTPPHPTISLEILETATPILIKLSTMTPCGLKQKSRISDFEKWYCNDSQNTTFWPFLDTTHTKSTIMWKINMSTHQAQANCRERMKPM